ncbi:hypothetical protein B0H19DRAFT_1383960 [Mycena capillaripes]|nr:hypothetical protein B0H19DRAFT_1383960 [Mycena capillaripes]
MKCARLVHFFAQRMPVESAMKQARRLPYARAAPSLLLASAPRSAASIRAALRWIAPRRLYRLRRITIHVSRRTGGGANPSIPTGHGRQGHRRRVYARRVAHTRPQPCQVGPPAGFFVCRFGQMRTFSALDLLAHSALAPCRLARALIECVAERLTAPISRARFL